MSKLYLFVGSDLAEVTTRMVDDGRRIGLLARDGPLAYLVGSKEKVFCDRCGVTRHKTYHSEAVTCPHMSALKNVGLI